MREKVVRIFNTYGPHMNIHDGRVVSNFIISALKNENITVYGKGSQTRSFCYITDLVDGIISMMETDDEFLGPVNLGNPYEITIFSLAEKIIELTGSKSEIHFYKLPDGDPVKRKPNICLAEQKLCWKPKIDLDSGLKKTISYFEKVLKK